MANCIPDDYLRVINKYTNYFSSVLLQKFLAWKGEKKLPVFENELLRKILGQKECEVSWEFKALPTGNFADRIVKLRVVRRVENAARTRQDKSYDLVSSRRRWELTIRTMRFGCEQRGRGKWLNVVPKEGFGISIQCRLGRIPSLPLSHLKCATWNVFRQRYCIYVNSPCQIGNFSDSRVRHAV